MKLLFFIVIVVHAVFETLYHLTPNVDYFYKGDIKDGFII